MGKRRPVTCMARSPVSEHLAVGYGDGSVRGFFLFNTIYLLIINDLEVFVVQIRIWNTARWECECTLTGHTGAVTCLEYSSSGDRLASGSQDTDIVVWDVSAESGLFKLRGHRGQVTGLVFLTGSSYLVTVSKDEQLRVWDLDSERCVQTVVCHGGELWDVSFDKENDRLAVGASDSQLRIFKVDGSNAICVLEEHGSLKRSTGDRVAKCEYVGGGEAAFLVCQGAGKVVDIWRIRSEKEAEKRKKRREKRKEEKKKKKKNSNKDKKEEEDADEVPKAEEHEEDVKAMDEVELIETIRCKSKVASFSVDPSRHKKKYLLRIVFVTSHNALEVWDVKKVEEDIESSKRATIDGPGHRSDVRSLALSSDDSLCVSTSNSGAKVWNPKKGLCICSIESGYGLCSSFVPGNKHAIVGTKEGTIEILDIGSSSRVEIIDAHQGPVWSICLQPDGSGFVSGSADKTIKFWEWTVAEEDSGASHLSIECTQTLTMSDDVLHVKFTPNGALLIASLLDSTVKVYFADTLKFFLSLYGHKLPVLTMDVSSDSTLLVTGSADKNIKIWGLDYGDCHKSIFAHDDSVMSVAFVPGTHYFFTAGKDGLIKYWDADKFEHLLDLPGHHSEVWAIAVSSLGDFIVSGSHDRSIRRWEKTEEAFFVEEEKEKRLESLFEEDLERKPIGEEEEPPPEDGVSTMAGKKTLETVSAADAIVEALDMAAAEEERIQESRKALAEDDYVPNPLLLGLSPSDYVLRAVGQVRGGDLQQALLLVPFLDALRLLEFCCDWLKQSSNVELLARVTILLCRVHMHQLMATPSARATLLQLKDLLHSRLVDLKDTWGYNSAAIEFLKRHMQNNKRGSIELATTFEEQQAHLAAALKQRKTS